MRLLLEVLFLSLISGCTSLASAQVTQPRPSDHDGFTVLDERRVAAELARSGAIEMDFPGDVYLAGDWPISERPIVIRAGGTLVADDWHLVSPGSRVTLQAAAIDLRGTTRLNVARPGGRAGDVRLTAVAGRVELAPGSVIDASGAPGRGGQIVVSGGDVRSHGTLLALGSGRIEVEARDRLDFLSRADTAGGVIRLDPTNLRIANFGGVNTGVAVAPGSVSPNAPPANGQLDAGSLATMLASNSVIVHTTSAAGPGTGLQPAITGDNIDGDITVEAPVTWSSAFSLTLLAHDDLIILAPVQNGSTGSVVGVSGWDGATMSGFDGNTVVPTAYGASGGNTFVVGTSNPDVNVSFGSRNGTTAIWAYNTTVRASSHTTTSFDGFAMIGFRIIDGTSATGPIQVTAHHDLSLLGGLDSLRFAQIGHGGELWLARPGTVQGDLGGNIRVTAGGALLLNDGNFTCYAQIGHGGLLFDTVTRGNLSGDVSVTAATITLTGDEAGGAQIGNGGTVGKASIEGDIDGAVTVQTGALTMTNGVSLAGGAHIGHGGSLLTALNPPPARVPPVVGDIGSNTAGGAPIVVNVSGNVILAHTLAANRSGISHIGHGGLTVFGGTAGTIAGDITLTAGGNITLSSGGNCINFCGSQVGHSAAQLAVFNSSVGAVRGDVVVSAGGTVSVTGGGATAGGGQLQYAQIGHGGPLGGAQDVFATSGTTSWGGTPASAGNTNDVTVTAANVIVQGGIGAVAYAQIGSGGLLASNDNTFSHVVQGPLDGNVNVTATTGDLTLAGGADPNALATAQIGNGGFNGSNPGVTTVTVSGASGSISVIVDNETSLVDAPGGSRWWLGHRTTGTLGGAPLLFDTGTLDFAAGPGATNATVSDPAFWTRLVVDPAPSEPVKPNAAGGSVTFRAHGLAGTDGNLISNQPLAIPAAISNPVHVLSTDDLTLNSPVSNSGSSVVDLVSDDANPNPPNLSLTALLTIGASAAPTGPVRLFAVGPAQFSKPASFTPAEKYGVWYQTFGTPIIGVNYKVSATPTITTQASAPVTVGGQISDDGVLAGGSSPAGSITFNAYGPNDTLCSGAVAFTATISVAGNGLYSSGFFTPGSAGTYRWTASYSGDASNNPASSPCNAPNESVVVNQATPGLTTQASGTISLGNMVSDTATLGGGVSPSGSINFQLYGPNDALCSGPVVFGANVAVAGNGVYGSGSFTPTQVGIYRWVAMYSGDANNAPATSPCNAPDESVTVNQANPTLVTQASPSNVVGNSISDSATLAGGVNPTGSLTFDLYGPNDAACSGPSVFTATIPVSGNATYPSGPFTPTQAGTYRWSVSYSGDSGNAAASSPCNAPNESVVVNQATPTLVTQASPAVSLGGSISDTAVLSGGFNPGGSITFTLFGANDATCSGTVAFTALVPVAGNGSYTSGGFTPVMAGSYRWVASYSGDSNNAAAISPCNAPNELVSVGVSAPTLSTQASGPVIIGNSISDNATLAGGISPTGSITFNVFGPDDSLCAAPALFTATVPVAGNGAYASGSFSPALAGTYRWIASYSGDANNGAIAGACNAPNENVVVQPATPVVSTQASPGITVGGVVSDSATLSGGVGPTGSMVFALYGPNDSTCSGPAIFTATVPVAGNGAYSSGPFTPASAGTYRWIASYGGDPNNAPVTGLCNAPNESVIVSGGAVIGGSKTVSAGPYMIGNTITYTIAMTNSGTTAQPDASGDEFVDVLPPSLALSSASATSGNAVATIGTNTVTWNGVIPPAATVTVTITATILPAAAGTTVANQGTIRFDADGNGSNESTTATDDPAVAGSSDATVIAVSAAAGNAPTLSPLFLCVLVALIAAIGVTRFGRLT